MDHLHPEREESLDAELETQGQPMAVSRREPYLTGRLAEPSEAKLPQLRA